MESINRPIGITAVREDVARACRDAGRDPATVTLVAISKTFGADAIEPVIAAGQRVFGENRVQEAKAKWPPLIARHGAANARSRVEIGNTKAEILRVAEEERSDLIVLGSRERHGLAILVNFTEDTVLHAAHCDVLAVRLH